MTQACQDEESAKALLQFIFRADTQEKIAQQEYGKIVLHKKTNEKLWENADESDEWKLACETLQSILQRVDHLNGCYDYSVIEIIAEESGAYFQADASVRCGKNRSTCCRVSNGTGIVYVCFFQDCKNFRINCMEC